MCSRYHIDSNIIDDIPDIMGKDNWQNRTPRDIRPSETAPVIIGRDKELHIQELTWGFKPPHDGKLLINARAESVLTKKTFSESALHRRIVIPARLFYEWDAGKQKVSFYRDDEKPIYMAGLYIEDSDGRRFTIITTAANNSMKPVHDRMPLIIEENAIRDWIFDNGATKDILAEAPGELIPRQEYKQMTIFDI